MQVADLFTASTTRGQNIDARSKIILLLAYSLGLFFLTTWAGLGIYALVLLILCFAARIPIGRLAKLIIPLYFILLVMLLCNAFVLDVNNVSEGSVFSDVSAGFASGLAPVALIGTFGFSPEGCMRGLFFVIRVVLLFIASMLVTFTTSSNQLVAGFSSLLRPLRAIKVPVDDIAMILSLSLRFIPMTAEKYQQIRDAQISRGASFATGGLISKVKGFLSALIPLFIGLFKKADSIADAMEARCYGFGVRSSLVEVRFNVIQGVILVAGLILFVTIAAIL